jgi:hypothetical protein
LLNNTGISENGASLFQGDPVGLKDGATQRFVVARRRLRGLDVPKIIEAAKMVYEPEHLVWMLKQVGWRAETDDAIRTVDLDRPEGCHLP